MKNIVGGITLPFRNLHTYRDQNCVVLAEGKINGKEKMTQK